MITKDMTIMEAVQSNDKAADVLLSIGMHCLGCAMAHGETIEEAAETHGVNIDKLIEMLNA